MEEPTSCRDREKGGADAGALCLSSSGCDSSVSHKPAESDGEEDRHKAPTHPHIHPLSLQNRGRNITDLNCQHSSWLAYALACFCLHVTSQGRRVSMFRLFSIGYPGVLDLGGLA